MITSLPPETLLEYGSWHRADYLLDQYGYTAGIAAIDGAALAALLPANYQTELKALSEELTATRKDRELAEADAKISTIGQNEAARQAKVWRRKVSHRALRATRMGKVIPEELCRISQARTIPALEGQMNMLTKVFEANMANIPGADNAALLATGKSIAAALIAANAAQEVKHLRSLPDSVRAFYIKKGTMYMGLKAINDAGRELHAENPTLASRYNLSILYRNVGRQEDQETQPTTPPVKPPAPTTPTTPTTPGTTPKPGGPGK